MNFCLRSCYRFRLRLVYVLSAMAVLIFSPRAIAQDEPESASDAGKAKPVSVAGVLEAIVSHELTADGDQIESWKLKRIVPHGTVVKKGQPVVWFDTEDAEKQLTAAEIELNLAKLSLEDEEFKYGQFRMTQRLDREAAARTMKKARQDHDHFMQTDRPRLVRTAEFNVESAEASVENAREELAQLEQMYRDDDMTEESEQIVLKRAKRSVESAMYRLEGTKIQSELMISRGIAEQTADKDDELTRAEMAHKQTMQDLESALKRRDIEIGKAREAFKEQQAKLEQLRSERRKSILVSPIDGIVLHGALTRGRIGDKASTLDKDSKVTAKQVIATIVNPGKLQIRVDLPEKELSRVKAGGACKIKVDAVPGFSGTGTVKSVGRVPYAATKYDCVVTLKKSKQLSKLSPTMTCRLEFEP